MRFGFVLGLCGLCARPLAAAELPGAELVVTRSKAAASCPSEQVLARELERRLAPRPPARERLGLSVQLDVEGRAFTAAIAVSGRRQGERQLSAEGPSCEALRDVLIVSLLLLLDDDAEAEAPTKPPKMRSQSTPSLWLSAGGAVTHGLPSEWSSAWYAEAAARWPSWDVGLGGLWAPRRSVEFSPGAVSIETLAATLHGCYVLGDGELRVGGCLYGVLSTLRGEGQAFTSTESARRTWLLLGLGPELRFQPWPRLSLGISGRLLGGPQRQAFAVRELPGLAYRSDRWVEWLGAELGVQLW